jgi:hypothetical protein
MPRRAERSAPPSGTIAAIRLASFTAGPTTVKSSRSGLPMLP